MLPKLIILTLLSVCAMAAEDNHHGPSLLPVPRKLSKTSKEAKGKGSKEDPEDTLQPTTAVGSSGGGVCKGINEYCSRNSDCCTRTCFKDVWTKYCIFPQPPEPVPTCNSYVVVKGDSCPLISESRCRTSDYKSVLYKDMYCKDPVTDSSCTSLQIYQALYSNCGVSPPGPAPSPTDPNCKTYIVQPGDNCWQIGEKQCENGNDWGSNLFKDSSCSTQMNDSTCGLMQVGQAIYSKCGEAPDPNCKPYTVQSGDNCWQIGVSQCNNDRWSTELFLDSSCSTLMNDSTCGTIQVGQVVYSKCN